MDEEEIRQMQQEYEQEAAYEAYHEEWLYARGIGEKYFNENIRDISSKINKEAWLNGFVQGWFSKQH